MASPTRWTWVWVSSGSLVMDGKPGVLQSMGSRRVRHDWATELNWTDSLPLYVSPMDPPLQPLPVCHSSCPCPVTPSLPHLSFNPGFGGGVPYLQPWWRQAVWTLLLFPVLQEYSFYFMLNHQVGLLQCFLFNAVTSDQLVYDFQVCVLKKSITEKGWISLMLNLNFPGSDS